MGRGCHLHILFISDKNTDQEQIENTTATVKLDKKVKIEHMIISRNISVLYSVLFIHRTYLILQIYFGEPQVVRLL